MPDTKLSALTELAAAPATTDELYIRDVSEPAADESKRITVANLFTSPTLVTPALGTPASGVLTNVTGLPTAGMLDDAVTYAKIQNISATDRVLGRTTAGAGDVEEIATTGSGSVVRATSPTLVTPALGTPASGVLTNVTGLPTAGLVDDAVTNPKLANMTANTVKANATALAADPADLAVGANTVVGRAAGDIVAAQVVTAQVADAAVTLAKMADIATARFIGRTTAATGVPESLTATQATALLDAATATVKGLVPTPPNNTTTFLRGDATFAAPAAGALTRAGGNTTEATTTSTTAVSLLTVASLSIAVSTPINMKASLRKTTGAAAAARAGVRLNTTSVQSGTNTNWSSAVDVAANGAYEFLCTYGLTAYLRAGMSRSAAVDANGNETDSSRTIQFSDMPTATLTDVILLASVADALVTMGADDMHVYSYSVS